MPSLHYDVRDVCKHIERVEFNLDAITPNIDVVFRSKGYSRYRYIVPTNLVQEMELARQLIENIVLKAPLEGELLRINNEIVRRYNKPVSVGSIVELIKKSCPDYRKLESVHEDIPSDPVPAKPGVHGVQPRFKFSK